MQRKTIPQTAVTIQRVSPVLPAERLLLLVPAQPYGSEGLRPVHDEGCPYYQQYGVATSCVSGSGGSMCGGFHGTHDGSVQCSWLPRQVRQGDVLVVQEADTPDDPRHQQAPWN